MSAPAYRTEIAEYDMKVSPSAAEQLKNLLGSIDDDIAGIRIFVSGGGCGGMTYGMTYAEAVSPHDKIMNGDGFKIMVDPVALGYLKGSDIDYVDNGVSKSFVFNNVFKSVGGTGGCSGCGGGGCGA